MIVCVCVCVCGGGGVHKSNFVYANPPPCCQIVCPTYTKLTKLIDPITDFVVESHYKILYKVNIYTFYVFLYSYTTKMYYIYYP